MMKKMGLLLIGLVLFGCLALPITPDEKTVTYTLGADASVKTITETRGPTTAAADKWEKDCTGEYQNVMTNALSAMQMLQSSTNASQEDIEQLDNLTKAAEILLNKTTCTFVSNNGNGTLTTTTHYTYAEQEEIYRLTGTSDDVDVENLAMKKNSDGTYSYRCKIDNAGGITGALSTMNKIEIRFIVEGEVLDITPGYVEENGMYVYKDAQDMTAQYIIITYQPAAREGLLACCPITGILAAFGGAAMLLLYSKTS